MNISKEILDEFLKGVDRPEALLGDAGPCGGEVRAKIGCIEIREVDSKRRPRPIDFALARCCGGMRRRTVGARQGLRDEVPMPPGPVWRRPTASVSRCLGRDGRWRVS